MKKKIIALGAALMLFAGVVSASSINGDYKGNPIVKVTSNGKQLETDEVPAQIYDGHTVVPISLLRQLGASVTWDANTYSVDVNLGITTPNIVVNDQIKKQAILANAYKNSQDVTALIENYNGFLSLFFNGENNNYDGRYTENDMLKRFDELTATNNKTAVNINQVIQQVKPLDGTKLQTIIDMNKRALSSFDQASASLLKWKDNKLNKESQTYFNEYLYNNNQAVVIIREATQIAYDEYTKNMQKIME